MPTITGTSKFRVFDPNVHYGDTSVAAYATAQEIASFTGQTIVSAVTDFPAPVGGVITLVAGVDYVVEGEVNIGTNTIAFGARSTIRGTNRINDRLVGDTTGTMFTVASGAVVAFFSEIGLRCPNGTLIDASGCSVSFVDVAFGAILNGGNIALSGSFSFGLRTSSAVSAFTGTGFTFTGTTTSSCRIFDNLFTNNAGTLFAFGAAVFAVVSVSRNVVNVSAAQTFVSGGGATNISTSGHLTDNAFLGAGTAVSGIAATDTPWVFASNSGVTNTAIAAEAAWGAITGALADQDDLQAALDSKQAAGSYATSATTSAADSKAVSAAVVGSAADSKASSAATAGTAADSKADSAASRGSIADSKAISVSTNTSVADSKADSSASRGSVADSKAVSAATQVSGANSKADSAAIVASVADSKAVSAATQVTGADSKADSAATVATAADSKGVSSGTRASAADSKAESVNTIADSKATSASVRGSVADSKALSVSTLTSTADSKGTSGASVGSVADSKALSVSTLTSTADSKAVSVGLLVVPAGGTVTQATSKATGVTLNTRSGAITMNAAALAAAAEVTFIVTNSVIAANDIPVAAHKSAGTAGAYAIHCNTVSAGAFRITVGNMSAGSLSEAIVIQFTILKGAIA